MDVRVQTILEGLGTHPQRQIAVALANLSIGNAEDLALIAECIVTRAVTESVDAEACADLCWFLRHRFPEFPPEYEGMQQQSFARFILCRCQDRFDNMSLPDEGPLPHEARVCLEFFGQLCVRKQLATKVICMMLERCRQMWPMKFCLEAICVMLRVIGNHLERCSTGRALRKVCCDLVEEWRSDWDGDSESLASTMDEILALRKQGWPWPESMLIAQCVQTAPDIFKASLLNGQEVACISGSLVDMSVEGLQEEVAQQMAVHACRIVIVQYPEDQQMLAMMRRPWYSS